MHFCKNRVPRKRITWDFDCVVFNGSHYNDNTPYELLSVNITSFNADWSVRRIFLFEASISTCKACLVSSSSIPLRSFHSVDLEWTIFRCLIVDFVDCPRAVQISSAGKKFGKKFCYIHFGNILSKCLSCTVFFRSSSIVLCNKLHYRSWLPSWAFVLFVLVYEY